MESIRRIIRYEEGQEVFESDNKESLMEPLLAKDEDSSTKLAAEPKAFCTSFFGHLMFAWMSPTMALGANRQLEHSDLLQPPDDMAPHLCCDLLWELWTKERVNRGANASVFRAICKAFGWPYLAAGIIKLVNDALAFLGPLLLHALVTLLDDQEGNSGGGSDNSRTLAYGYCIAAALGLTSAARAMLGTRYTYEVSRLGLRLRASVTTVVFRKALSVRMADRSTFSHGEIQTLMSVDADRIVSLCLSAHELWSLPLQLGVALFLLYLQVRFAFVAGLAVVILLIPINRWLALKIGAASEQMMKDKDDRVRQMGEVLSSIRTIKLHAWESLFTDRVNRARSREMRSLAVRKYLDAFCVYFWACTPLFFSLLTFGLFTLLGHRLTAATVFTSLALFNLLLGPLNSFPWVINGTVEAGVSLRRLRRFLLAPDSLTFWSDDESESDAWHHLTLEDAGPSSFQWAAPADATKAAWQDDNDVVISFQDASFAWSTERGGSDEIAEGIRVCLHRLTLDVPRGSLIVVIGEVAAGKSNFLAAILGQMKCTQGSFFVRGSTALVPENPWIQSGTFQDNVLFGSALDASRYDEVLKACALDADVARMPDGDLTEIGERGFNLSGGQKARLALARAVYSQADILLLDDPLAAVDGQVAAHLLKNVLKGPLRASSTLVLCTHHRQALNLAEVLVVMRQGKICYTGSSSQVDPQLLEAASFLDPRGDLQSRALPNIFDAMGDPGGGSTPETGSPPVPRAAIVYQELTHGALNFDRRDGHQSGPDHAPIVGFPEGDRQDKAEVELATPGLKFDQGEGYMLKETEIPPGKHDHLTTGTMGVPRERRQLKAEWAGFGSMHGESTELSAAELARILDDEAEAAAATKEKEELEPLVAAEERVSGLVHVDVYRRYAWAMGGAVLAIIVLSLILMQASKNASDLWLSVWVDAASASAWHGRGLRFYLGILAALALANSVFTFIRAFLFAFGGLHAARRLHTALLQSIISAPIDFFDSTPIGRILNRFSSDLYTVDDSLPFILNILLANSVSMIGILAVLLWAQWTFLILLLPLSYLYFIIQHYYRASSRELRRLDSTSRSPIYAAFTEALEGTSTICAFRAQARFAAENEQRVALNQKAALSELGASLWLSVRLQLMAALIVAFIAVMAVVSRHLNSAAPQYITAGMVGLSLSYALPITTLLNDLLVTFAETEKEMVAVERLCQYLEIENEQAGQGVGVPAPPGWPSRGEILFEKVSMRYRLDLPLALSDLSVTIAGGEQVGIAGRTGAGKSSILAALFRLYEISTGRITVDGVDLKTLRLQDLRSHLSIIPQSPFLFQGTLRENLNPVDEHNDTVLWDILHECHLAEAAVALGGLDGEVSDSGTSLSLGQRQLLCLARALLQRSKVLCLDESTASVDPTTAQLLEDVMMSHCQGVTVVTIAHRLDTLLRVPRILLIEHGRLLEDGNPQELLKKPESHFAALTRAADQHH